MKVRPAKNRRVIRIGKTTRKVRGTITHVYNYNNKLYFRILWDDNSGSNWLWTKWKEYIEIYDNENR